MAKQRTQPEFKNGKKIIPCTRFRVTETAELMQFLLAKMGGMSRNSVKSLLAHRQVQVNGQIQTQYNLPLNAGDSVIISAGKGNEELKHPKLRVVYEDNDLIVVEKKEGLLTVATERNSLETTVFSILRHYVKQSNPRNGIHTVHRLDRETSGLLVFAKSKETQEYMQTCWKNIVTQRAYVAVVEGKPAEPQGTIRTWLTENQKSKKVYSSPTDNGGQLSITHYKLLESNERYSLLRLQLETGRKNQIRVHLADMGNPVVGDKKYGSGTTPIRRIALHAYLLEFIHPVTQQKLRFESAMPKSFRLLLQPAKA